MHRNKKISPAAKNYGSKSWHDIDRRNASLEVRFRERSLSTRRFSDFKTFDEHGPIVELTPTTKHG